MKTVNICLQVKCQPPRNEPGCDVLVDDGAGEVVKEVDGLRNVDGPLDFLLLPQPAKQWCFCQH